MKINLNFRFSTKRTLSLLIIFSTLFSCQKEDVSNETETSFSISQKVKDKLFSLGVNGNFAVEHTNIDESGSHIKGWLINDIFIPKDELFSMPSLDEDQETNSKLFRTRNLVAKNRTYRIDVSGIPRIYQDAVRTAIQRYNALRLSIRFVDNSSNPDIVVRITNTFLAQFPSNGRPGRDLQLAAGQTNTDLIASITMHELGHAIGLRHSDFRTRRSCTNGFNEGQADIGAIHIPGTDATGDSTQSIMVACGFKTGQILFSNFFGQDRIALNFLYK